MDPFFGLLIVILVIFACVYVVKHVNLDSIIGIKKIEKKEDNVIYGTWKSYGTPNRGTFEARLPKKIYYDVEFKVDVSVRNFLAGIKGTNFVGMISKGMDIIQTNTRETDKQIKGHVKRINTQKPSACQDPDSKGATIKMSGIILGSKITYKAEFNDLMDSIVGGYKLINAFQSGRSDIGYFGGETRNQITVHEKKED